MPANTVQILDNLSYDGIKNSLKTFLRQQTLLQDYDFEASNLGVLIDLLAYNTQQNAYLLNMVFNEGFIDTADLYDSIASHAKSLAYTPRSRKSASAILTIQITPTANVPYITIPENTVFSAVSSNASLSFRTTDPYIAYSTDSYMVSGVTVYEGQLFTESYIMDYTDPSQQFIINNENVDIDSTTVRVINNNEITQYNRATSLLDYDSNSNIFFIETIFNNRYQIIFGDNTVGKRPENGSSIYITYRVPSGEGANGVNRFTVGSIDGHSNVAVTVTSSAAGGAERESVESVRFYAPKFYQARERAVTVSDYETLLSINYPEIRAIHAYGGETLDPPQFGKVAISIDLEDADGISEGREQIYYNFLKKRCPVSIEPIFIDPDFLDLKVVCNVKYNPTLTFKSASQISANVLNSISTFNNTYLGDFDTTLYMSKLMETINDVDTGIRGNELSFFLKRSLDVQDSASTYSIDFHNEIKEESLVSSAFEYNATTCYFGDLSGNVTIYSYVNNAVSLLSTAAGTIDYENGTVDISSISITSDSGLITFTATPANQDVSTEKNTILQIDDTDIIITTTTVTG